MLDKMRMGTMFAVIGLLIISILTFGINQVIALFSNDNSDKFVNKDEIVIEKNIVNNYSEFFTIENIVQKIVTEMHDGNYEDLYEIIYINDSQNKEEYIQKLKNYYNSNFKYELSNIDDSVEGYNNYNNLLLLYNEGDYYIAKVKTINGDTLIGIKTLRNNQYIINYLEL